MRKSIYRDEYRVVTEAVRQMRKEAQLTQRGFAKILGWPQNSVTRLERGQRRLDVLEFREICKLLDLDAPLIFAELCNRMDQIPNEYPESTSPSELKRVADKGRGTD